MNVAVAVACNTEIPTAIASAVSIRAPAVGPANGTGFSERALAEYIRALSAPGLSKTAKDLRANLAAAIAGDEPQGTSDQTVFHRTIIISVEKAGLFNPADRLEATVVRIKLSDNARFNSWDTVATAYTTVNAGTVTLTQARTTTEGLSVGAPAGAPITASGTLGGTQADTRVEAFPATTQIETLSAIVSPNGESLTVRRQGGPSVDLTGNTVIKVDIAYAGPPQPTFMFSVDAYKDKKGTPIPPAKLSVTMKPILAVLPGTQIGANVSLDYTLRHVVSGDSIYEEKDDQIVEISERGPPQSVILIPAREAAPSGFTLRAFGGWRDKFVLNIEMPGRTPSELCIGSYEKAEEFLAYMKVNASRGFSHAGKAVIGFAVLPDQPLEQLSAPVVKTLNVQSGCV